MTTTLEYSNLDTSEQGYYYSRYHATNGSFYEIDFRIVFKVGNPVNGDRVPQEHIHYNYSSTWEDQLLNYGEIDYINGVAQTEVALQEYTYDDQGNPDTISNFKYTYYNDSTGNYEYYTSSGVATLSWSGRELTKIEIPLTNGDSFTIEYKYNDQGYRTEKKVTKDVNSSITIDTIKYELIDDKVVYETDGNYAILYTYDYDGTLISFNYDSDISDQVNGSEYFYVRNQMGDISHIISSSGIEVVHYVYDAYGNVINTEVELGYEEVAERNSYGYRVYRLDRDTNLYYLNSRYYNSEVGRFINADGYMGELSDIFSTNMYIYCVNNPILYVDYYGDKPIMLFGYIPSENISIALLLLMSRTATAVSGLELSYQMFAKSLQSNRDMKKITQLMIKKLRGSDELISSIDEHFDEIKRYGKTSFSCSFENDLDLKLSLHSVTVQVNNAIRLRNGFWILNITIKDKYDFAKAKNTYDTFTTFINDMAFYMQPRVVKPYSVSVKFDILYKE